MVLIERLDACHFLEYSAKHWGQHLAGENAEKQLEPLIMEFLRNEQLRKSAFQALQFRREYASKDLADDIFDAIPADQGELHIAASMKATLPVQIAVDAQEPVIFNLLVQHLQTPNSKGGDANFHMIWDKECFDIPVSHNPWRTLTRGGIFQQTGVDVRNARGLFQRMALRSAEMEVKSTAVSYT